MTWLHGDSFDPYAAIADAGANFWDSSTGWSLSTGRFAGSQAYGTSITSNAANLIKSSGSNDATHHVVVAFLHTGAVSGSTLGLFIELFDGTTAQCTIVFRSDGAILLTSGAVTGSVLATYTGAFVQNVWAAFEFEVTINNTTGAFHVRKDGAASDSFAATGLNTRPVSTNNYANKIGLGNSGTGVERFDDFLWFNTTGAAPNTWVGDIRATWQAPASNSSQQFAPSPNPAPVTIPQSGSSTIADATGTARYTFFTASYDGTLGAIVVNMGAAATGNLKCTLFADSGSNAPGAIVSSATTLVNPVLGANTITFPSPPTVVQGVKYWLGLSHDVTMTVKIASSSTGVTGTGVAYASFPTASPTTVAGQNGVNLTANITPTLNYEFVNEAQEDGLTSYVFDSTVGHADFYGIQSLAATPASIIALQTRLWGEKDNAGARTGAVQLKSGGTTVQTTLVLSTSFQWISRVDTVDPNTSSAWGATAVNNVLIGPEMNA